MDEFKVEHMSCSHCVSAITQAVKALDPMAKVEVDLASKTVRIESDRDRPVLAGALTEAGYSTT